jgi:hypothetical protein
MADDFKDRYCAEPSRGEPAQKKPGFPRSVCDSHWIESPNEHEKRPGESLVTHDHDVIVAWAEARDAMPATVPGTEHDGRLGVLRFDIPGYGGSRGVEHVTWEQWFETFDERQLVMIFQEHMESGRQSNFFHFNSPFREHM